MKNKVLLFILCCLISISQMDCKNPTKDLRLQISTAGLFTSPIAVQFVNASNTSSTIIPNFDVNIGGKDANIVYTSDGGTTYKSFNGFISLTLDKSANPTITNPVTFTITATIPGFAPVLYTATIKSNKITTIHVPVVELANLPVNTTSQTKQVSITGNTAPATTFTLPATSTLANPATISMAAGTTLMDINGNAVSGSQLNTTIIQFGGDSSASSQAIPGGLSPATVIGKDGNMVSGGVHFVAAGALSINMKVNGTDVRKFGTPLQVSMPISNNVVNINSGKTVTAGDTINLYSIDETTGAWKYESNVVVASVGGILVANFQVSHLSSYVTGYPVANSCPSPFTLTINPSVAGYTGGSYGVVLAQGSTYIGTPVITQIYTGSQVVFDKVPNNIAGLNVVVVDLISGAIQVLPITGCPTSQTITMPVTVPNILNVATNFKGRCTNKAADASLTGVLVLTNTTNKKDIQVLNVENGIASFSVANNSTYLLTAIYQNKSYDLTYTFDKANPSVPTSTGGTTIDITKSLYDITSNTLNVAGSISFSCN